MQLDPVGAGFLGAGGGIGEHLDQMLGVLRGHHLEVDLGHLDEIGLRQFLGQEAVDDVAWLGRLRDRGTPDRAPLLHVGHRHQAAEMQLQSQPGAMLVHHVGDAADAGDMPVTGQADLPLAIRADRVPDRHRPHGQQGGASLGPRRVIGTGARTAHAVRLGQIVAHRRHEDAVLEVERSDPAR